MQRQSVPTEDQEAIELVRWLISNGIRHHHSPNETGSTPEAKRRAIRMKRIGTSPGYPDYTIIITKDQSADGNAYELKIELKRLKGSTTSDAQADWVKFYNEIECPYIHAYVAKGAQEAKKIISHYLLKVDNSVF